ncbi:polyphosphate kinase 1 [Lactovum miscens]|uniref:Polyphosphate kinase n=1 Tax=Lactovum miscens TaxID=190387 RepID=A0A841C7Q9_9LACT|nr:polyphosphate kinase 1 [Lactovum miscens]MBB5887280.1 polyphosphate kinase [Lactovum miscens]
MQNTQDAQDANVDAFTNRELSWLQFNERVLEEAESPSIPTFERLRFLSIFMGNLDEFFRVRVGMLGDQLLLDDDWKDNQTKMTVNQQLNYVFRATRRLIKRFNETYQQVNKEIRKYGVIHIESTDKLEKKDEEYLRRIFKFKIAPLITPFIVEKKHPMPFFENDQIIVGCTLITKNGNNRFGFLPVPNPNKVERIICLPSNPGKFILVEELILFYADRVFHKFTIEDKMIFSVVRNADIDEDDGLYDYDPNFSDTMAKIVEVRNLRAPIMIKYQANDAVPKLINYLARSNYLFKRQFFEYLTPLEFNYISELEPLFDKKMKPKLYFPIRKPVKSLGLDENGDLINQISSKDVLVSYPFESISGMVNLLHQAAKDERVTEISMTLYRASKHSKIVESLIKASKLGKKVTCIVELRARFDEENNIELSDQLSKAGVNVLYGLPGYKVHSKLLLIELSNNQKIALIGTGNFNETTARFYTDVALMTANADIASEVKQVFINIQAESFVQQAEHLLVSPLLMKQRLIELIDEEIEKAKSGLSARIVMKMNSLTEKDLMKKFIEASQEGVKIELIVRGICCLIPGVPGKTENIKIRSIVGRYLEHSRIFVFGAKEESRKYYISSADIMTRNLTGRVEVATPIYDKDARKKLAWILKTCLADNVNASEQNSKGKYKHVKAGKVAIDSQSVLAEMGPKSEKEAKPKK